MTPPCPELLFVSGPQEGQRVVLLKQVMSAGRAEVCDVHLAEEFASRRHLQFEITPDGCALEVLSPRGLHINGKAYKPGKKILLDTGDCLGIGAATNILFVGAGDDPEAALTAYRKAHPLLRPAKADAKEEAPPAETAPPGPAREEAAKPTAPGAAGGPEELQAQAKRAKVRKYAILGGVYAAAMVVLVIVLAHMKHDDGQTSGGVPIFLPDSAVEEAIREPLSRGSNENLAAEDLRQAQVMFDSRKFRPGNLQKCVKAFKMHLAYLNRQEFQAPENTTLFQSAREELIQQVKDAYTEARNREMARQWSAASQKWDQLLVILPHDPEWNTAAYNKLVDNVMAHAGYVRIRIPSRR
jgi:hypothetical protein